MQNYWDKPNYKIMRNKTGLQNVALSGKLYNK